jgi:uncharacterized protein (DUF488 family)
MTTSPTSELFTVGHSTRSLDELVGVLSDAQVAELIDVRSVPRSRRHPQFNADSLSEAMPGWDIAYTHARALGGFRKPVPGSPNAGWEHEGFRGYADYMATPEFRAALGALQERGRGRRACVMCAEAQWWRCHRRLIADALLIRGWRVLHLGLGREPVPHELTPFAVRGPDDQLTYPPVQTELPV